MIELFKHIFHRDFDWLFSNYGIYIYAILFLVIFIETGLVIMPFLPGDSLLFTAGIFAHQGNMNIAYIILLLFVAAVLGDNLNYFIGKKIGLNVFKLNFRGKPLVKQQYLDRTHLFFEKYGSKAIILARFVPFVRTFTPFVAGIAEMKYRTFLSFDLFGGAIWIVSLTMAGYFLGGFDIIKNNIDAVAVLIVILSVLPIIIGVIKAKMNNKESGV